MTNDTLEVIKRRRSIRQYEPEQIKEHELEAILEAGIHAPSAINQQSWHLTVIRNKGVLDSLNQAAVDFMKGSGQENMLQMVSQPGFHVFHRAPTAIIVSGDINALLPQSDCAAAIENMLIAAESMGIGSCWVNSVIHLLNSSEGARFIKELKIPEGYKPMHAVSLGYKPSGVSVEAPPRKANAISYIK